MRYLRYATHRQRRPVFVGPEAEGRSRGEEPLMPSALPPGRRRSVRRSLVIILALPGPAGPGGGKRANTPARPSRPIVSDRAAGGVAEAAKPQRGGKLIYGI